MHIRYITIQQVIRKMLDGLPDFAEAVALCSWFAGYVTLLPASRVARMVADRPTVSAGAGSAYAVASIRVRCAMSRVARFWPLPFSCLSLALAARAMLARRGCAAELHLGVARNEKKLLKAHAWLTVGKVVVTGRRGHRAYRTVGKFGHEK